MPETQVSFLPVVINDVHPALRLTGIVSELPSIVAGVEATEAHKNNVAKLTEALFYVPPLEEAASAVLRRVNYLFSKPKLKEIKPEDFAKFSQTFGQARPEINKPDNQEGATRLAKNLGRRVTRLLHPDTNDPIIPHLFSEADQRILYSQAVSAMDNGNLVSAQHAYLNVMPRYYQTLLTELHMKGMTTDEIAKSYPDMLSDLESVRYVAHVTHAKEFQDGNLPNTVTEEARRKIIRRKERESRGGVLLQLNHSLETMGEYVTEHEYPSAVIDGLTLLRGKISKAGFITGTDLWYEDVHEADTFPESLKESATAINDILRDIPVQVLTFAKSMALKGQSSTLDELHRLTASVDTLHDAVLLHHQELKASPIEANKLTLELRKMMDTALAGTEEKNLAGGLRLRIAKKTEGTIWDTLIQQYSHTFAGGDTVSHVENYILVDDQWWFHSRRSRYHSRDGMILMMPEGENRFERTDTATYFSTLFSFENNETQMSFEESPLAKEARKNGFKPASAAQVEYITGKITDALDKNEKKV